ncbi:phosphosulfolactate synthase [Paralcaligenes ginsengisoli]
MDTRAPFDFVTLPAARSSKPRRNGRTMMIDDGLPLGYTADLMAMAGDYVDLAKIKTGTARLYTRENLQAKLALYRQYQVRSFLGGQFHEYILATQGEAALPRFYDEALSLGFETIEISDNVVPLTAQQRVAQIRAAVATGLTVFGEVGSKETLNDPSLLVDQARDCFDAGAELVLVEAAELVENGKLRAGTIELLMRQLDMTRVMIELPGPWIAEVRSCDIESMKKTLISVLGPDVNLANVAASTLIDTEAARVGLGTAGPGISSH